MRPFAVGSVAVQELVFSTVNLVAELSVVAAPGFSAVNFFVAGSWLVHSATGFSKASSFAAGFWPGPGLVFSVVSLFEAGLIYSPELAASTVNSFAAVSFFAAGTGFSVLSTRCFSRLPVGFP